MNIKLANMIHVPVLVSATKSLVLVPGLAASVRWIQVDVAARIPYVARPEQARQCAGDSGIVQQVGQSRKRLNDVLTRVFWHGLKVRDDALRCNRPVAPARPR